MRGGDGGWCTGCAISKSQRRAAAASQAEQRVEQSKAADRPLEDEDEDECRLREKAKAR